MVGFLAVVDCRSPDLGETIVSPKSGLRQSTTAKKPTIVNAPVGETTALTDISRLSSSSTSPVGETRESALP